MNGYIPEKLIYILRAKERIQSHWDDSTESLSSVDAQKAYVVPDGNKKPLENARSWATLKVWHPESKSYKDSIPAEEVTVSNDPIDSVRIIGLERRRESGSTYKAVIFDKYYVDLREDVLLDAILHCSIKNGLIEDKFIWARVETDMKLVRVGSWLHKEMIKATEADKAPKIKTLEVGGVYESKSSGPQVFLGIVNTEEWSEQPNQDWRAPKAYTKTANPAMFCFAYLYSGATEIDPKKSSLDFKKSHSLIRKTGYMRVPENWQELYIKYVEENAERYKDNPNMKGVIASYSRILSLANPRHPLLSLLES